jgi:hypothetical protein
MRLARFIGALMVAALFITGARVAQAQGTSAASFTLPAGGTATISFTAFCTNFGQKFPTSIQAPNALAPDNVRAALAYIQAQNLHSDPAQALEAQYAIWQLVGATGSPAGGATTQQVVQNATAAPANPQGTSLLDAVTSNQVTVSLASWAPIGQPVPIGNATDNFFGQGTVTVRNNTQQPLTLFMPVGTLFPPATAGDQTMAGFATNVDVQQAQAATATTGATAAATATTAATTAATAAATATTAATTAATAAATATRAATTAATAAATATTTAPGTLPNTADGGGSSAGLLLLGALALLGAGMLARRALFAR